VKRVLGYIRVSTDKQVDKGISLEVQRAKLGAYCQLYDLELVDVIVDPGESAKSLKRPGVQSALSRLAAGEAEGLLVVKLDRLTRSVRDLGDLVDISRKQGWALISVGEQLDTSSAAGRMVMNILAVISQWEREAIGERTSAALKHKAAKGEYTGGTTRYGVRSSGKGSKVTESVAEEQIVLAEVARLRGSELSYQAIADELAARGIFNRKGNRFAPMQVARIAARAA
jgi:DNA invertase Pin-like site-specific DNA recombinase